MKIYFYYQILTRWIIWTQIFHMKLVKNFKIEMENLNDFFFFIKSRYLHLITLTKIIQQKNQYLNSV